MFDARAVRRRVEGRLKVLSTVREEDIHDAYAKEIATELGNARRLASLVVGTLDSKVKAAHPKQGWLMFSKEDIESLNKRFQDFYQEMR